MPDNEAVLRRQLKAPHGMILVTGPTGSGKTTTLYGALRTLDAAADKIISIEDPLEYQINGVTQIQVKPEIELSFARIALVTVLWFVALMSALAVAMVGLGRDTALASRHAAQVIEARALMTSAVELAVSARRRDRWSSAGPLDWRQGLYDGRVAARPESAKIDLNAASDDVIEAPAATAAAALGRSEDAGLALGRTILDWHDPAGSLGRRPTTTRPPGGSAGRAAGPFAMSPCCARCSAWTRHSLPSSQTPSPSITGSPSPTADRCRPWSRPASIVRAASTRPSKALWIPRGSG